MKDKQNKKTLSRIITALVVVGLLLSLAPIIIASFYAHPVSDDFGFSEKVKQAVSENKGVFGVISASLQQVKESYLRWQGTYSAVFIFSLQPAVFSDNLYFLTTIIMLTSLIASTVILLRTFFDALGLCKRNALLVSCVILFLSIHFVIDKREAFFWWNGCSYYTLFYAFSLLFLSLLIKLYSSDKRKTRVVCFIFALILAVVIGGGNYSTALLTTVIMTIIIAIVLKNKKSLLPYYLILFCVLLAGFIVSMVAPGNGIRAAAVTGESPVKAILHSLYYANACIAKWTGLAQIAGFVLIAIVSLMVTRNTEFQFKHPMAVLLISALTFATQFTPPLYAMSNIGAGRQINIYYYSYYLFATLNILYFCGWLSHKEIVAFRAPKKSFFAWFSLILVYVFALGCLVYGFKKLTFFETAFALKNGTPQAYSIEYRKAISEIQAGATEINDVKTVPSFFSALSIKEDPSFWMNKQIAEYYRVDEIKLKKD